jgi:hypothetical protein
MKKGIEIRLGSGDREGWTPRSGNGAQKPVWRARIVLLSAEEVGTRRSGGRPATAGKPTIWRWQARFTAEGVDGPLHEATRTARKPPLR